MDILEKKKIIKNTIADVHNLDFLPEYAKYLKSINKRINTPYWYKLEKHEKIKIKSYKFEDDGYKTNINLLYHHDDLYDNLDTYNVFYVSYVNKVILYTIFQMFLKFILQSNLLFTLSFAGYLFIIEEDKKTVLHPFYVDKLEKRIDNYIEQLFTKINKNITYFNFKQSDFENELHIDKTVHGYKKSLIRIANEINKLHPNLFRIKPTKNNADVIIKKSKRGDLPDINVLKNNIAVELTYDDSVFCIGTVEEETKIIKIKIQDDDIIILDSLDYIIYVY